MRYDRNFLLSTSANLVQVRVSSEDAGKSYNELCVAVFNARSVSTPEKRCEIASFVLDNGIDILFITETWLKASGDEAKCVDLAPPGFTVKSFPRPSRGGGIAIIARDSLLPFSASTSSFQFAHSSFELVHTTLSLPSKLIHLFTVYRPPPSKKNKLTDSLFFDQFPDLLDYCNTLKGNLIILGDFNFHHDLPTNPNTARLLDILNMFSLSQAVKEPTHNRGHTLDWVLHREEDGLLLSTQVSHAIESDHYCVINHLDVSIPLSKPVFIERRNLRAIDKPAFSPQDM
nr:hypothetical protein BaRGS_011366 [Batillaria attramentaria]